MKRRTNLSSRREFLATTSAASGSALAASKHDDGSPFRIDAANAEPEAAAALVVAKNSRRLDKLVLPFIPAPYLVGRQASEFHISSSEPRRSISPSCCTRPTRPLTRP